MVVAVGNRVLFYNAETGELIESLRGHKDAVLCVDYCYDGSRFASGGADNVVVIWKSTGAGMLKYTHTAPVQRVKWNPQTIQLASCSEIDFGLWTPDQNKVVKEKVASKVLSVSWSTDGTALALGMMSGVISIRNQQAEEVMRIEKKAPVWCLSYIPNYLTSKVQSNGQVIQNNDDLLIVGCWDKTLSFYKFAGNTSKLQAERQLRYYPCSIALAGQQGNKFNYLLVSGSNKKVTMYSRDGIRLADIISDTSWVWTSACNTHHDRVVAGSDAGQITAMQMTFDVVHALFKDRYAYRENLTEIIVHNLVTDRKVRIKCKDLIRRIALFKNKLAVQLTDRVCIYESNPDDFTDMHFRLRKERITISDKGCDSIGVTTQHLLFCKGDCVELYSFDGTRHRVWKLETAVSYMRVDGGPAGREGVLLGLESGAVLKVFVDNPFPIDMTKRPSAILGVDCSLYRTRVACVDSSNLLTVTDLKTQEVVFSFQDAVSCCFNSEVDGTLCFTSTAFVMYVVSGLSADEAGDGGGLSSVSGVRYSQLTGAQDKAKVTEPQEQHSPGLALGFQGQKIFCLNRGAISAVDVPQGANLQTALDQGDMKAAYSVACLGATEADWKLLSMRALRANALSVAKKAFARLKDTKFLNLIETIERDGDGAGAAAKTLADRKGARARGKTPAESAAAASTQAGQLDPTWLAEILAFEGHHHEAAKIYARAGRSDEAIRLFTDMRRWADAKLFAQSSGVMDVSSLTMAQAKWLQEINDWRGSAELYLSMGQGMLAATIVAEAAAAAEAGWQKTLIDVVRQSASSADSAEVLNFCGDVFIKHSEDELARETYQKVGNFTMLMTVLVNKQMWAEAAALADANEGKFDMSVFLPYAEYLVAQDRYEEAMKAFRKAGRGDLARAVLEELTFNAVSESRFKDAAYYYWMLSKEAEGGASAEYARKADLYFAFAGVHAYVTDPFTTHQPEALFQVSRFIINSLGSSEGGVPHGVSKAATLYTLAKQAMVLGTFKLARHAYDRLGKMVMPQTKRQEEVELDMLLVMAKPVRDDPDHLPVCYRCSSTNPLLNPLTNKLAKGDSCTNCGHPFVRSFTSFDVLPLVEFAPDPSISDDDAIELIRQQPGAGGATKSRGKSGSGWKEGKMDDADVMTLDDDDYLDKAAMGPGGMEKDSFTRALNLTLETQGAAYRPIALGANALANLKRSEVFVCRSTTKGQRATFYRNMLPDIAVAVSQPCNRFFHLEDFEFAYLSNKGCPYSRLKNVGEYGSL